MILLVAKAWKSCYDEKTLFEESLEYIIVSFTWVCDLFFELAAAIVTQKTIRELKYNTSICAVVLRTFAGADVLEKFVIISETNYLKLSLRSAISPGGVVHQRTSKLLDFHSFFCNVC